MLFFRTMKRRISFTILIAVACAVSTWAQREAVVTSKTAQFRESPSKTAKVIFTVRKGAKLKLESTGHKNGWYSISVLNGKQKGWIHGNDIKIDYTDIDNYIQNKIASLNEKGETIEEFSARVRKTFPSEWVYFGLDVNNCLHYYSKNRILYEGNDPMVWLRGACFRASSMMDNVPELNQILVKANVFYRLDKTKIDCARQKFGIFIFYFYDQNEKQIGSMSEIANPQLFDIPPNSVFENLLTLCKTK